MTKRLDVEVKAMRAIWRSLKDLKPSARLRILTYFWKRFFHHAPN